MNLPDEQPERRIGDGSGEDSGSPGSAASPAASEWTGADETERPEVPFWRYQDVLIALALAIPLFVLAFGTTSALIRLAPWRVSDGAKILIPQFIGYGFAIVPVILLFRWKYDRPFWSSIGNPPPPSAFLPTFFSGVGLAAAILLAGAILRPPEIDSPLQHLMDDPASAILVAIFACTLGPMFEEIFFRGLLQPLSVQSVGVIAGIVLTALAFALLHGPQYAWSWKHLFLITAAGVAFGWKRHRSGSTISAAILHAGYNATLVGGYLIGRNQL